MDTVGATGQTVITEDVEIMGTIKAAGGLRIDGKLNGDLNCAGDVTVGKNAVIKGNMSVNATSVHGTINGNIAAKDRIELKAAARIVGDVKAKRLTVEDGVSFIGKAEVNPSGATGPRPQASGESDDEARVPVPGDSAAEADQKSKGGGSFFSRK